MRERENEVKETIKERRHKERSKRRTGPGRKESRKEGRQETRPDHYRNHPPTPSFTLHTTIAFPSLAYDLRMSSGGTNTTLEIALRDL